MAQIKIYGRRRFLEANAPTLSTVIHGCTMAILGLPEDKRFHRFLPVDDALFIHPPDRGDRYLIIEIALIAGRTVETRKRYLKALIEALHRECGIPVNAIEITLQESPPENWGIRGVTGDELKLNYRIDR
ncbi:MAG: tautomerase family protein [Puniceicoccaceae bacterium]|nr:MAG: tautomerase family protein [Puniceicoccaceae bacterium]